MMATEALRLRFGSSQHAARRSSVRGSSLNWNHVEPGVVFPQALS